MTRPVQMSEREFLSVLKEVFDEDDFAKDDMFIVTPECILRALHYLNYKAVEIETELCEKFRYSEPAQDLADEIRKIQAVAGFLIGIWDNLRVTIR